LELIKSQQTHKPQNWMSDLAMGSIYLKEGNTFAKSIWLYLTEKVSHQLATVISACDLLSGLDHVIEQNWVRKFFIRIMKVVDTSGTPAITSSFRYFIDPFNFNHKN